MIGQSDPCDIQTMRRVRAELSVVRVSRARTHERASLERRSRRARDVHFTRGIVVVGGACVRARAVAVTVRTWHRFGFEFESRFKARRRS
jgi:hypothetical protein